MTVEIELNRLPDLSDRDDEALQFSSIPYLAEPCSYDQVEHFMWCTFGSALTQRCATKRNCSPHSFSLSTCWTIAPVCWAVGPLVLGLACPIGGERVDPGFAFNFSIVAETHNPHELIVRLDHILTLVGSAVRVPVTNCDIR